MNHEQWRAIERHGKALLRAFPKAPERDPVLLCKQLRRVEKSLEEILCRNCNTADVTEEEMDASTNKAKERVIKILGISARQAHVIGLFVNRDPRGYALKLDDGWVHDYHSKLYARKQGQYAIHTDMGGYGILAPDYSHIK